MLADHLKLVLWFRSDTGQIITFNLYLGFVQTPEGNYIKLVHCFRTGAGHLNLTGFHSDALHLGFVQTPGE